MPLQHIVLCTLTPGTDADFEQIIRDLDSLRRHLTMGAIHYGPNTSPEGLARGYTHGFVIEFPNAPARDAYLADKTHKAIGARLVKLCEGGMDGLLVMDI